MIKLFTNPWVLLGLTLSIIGLLGGVYAKGYSSGKDKCETAQERANKASTDEAIQIRNNQNEIRNNRPDTDALVNSLLDGSF